jgi:methylated-DNA-[protein]-cysteine S-methyltransferase
MKPTLVQYEAPGWGVGEIWLDEEGRVFHCELPRPRTRTPSRSRRESASSRALRTRAQRFFAGKPDDFLDVLLVVQEGFYGDCVRVLRSIPRGEVVTYGELASLAGFPGAARAAGTFCGRCALSPFVPTHRVVGSNGIGSYGDLGVDYKRRLLALEGVTL